MRTFVLIFALLAATSFTTSLPAIAPSSADATLATAADATSRIVNGYQVDITEVPYQAALRRRVTSGWAHMCGAVVINIRAVLTAAHCAIGYEAQPSSLRIVVATSYRLSGGTTYDVSRVNVHESYDTTTLQNDIAMLVTSKRISFGRNVRPIALAPPNVVFPAGTVALVSGYGTTAYEGPASSVLLAARVNIVSQQECARAYLRIAEISTGMMCANASNPPRDACQGDSGGPLAANGLLVGIVSWGEGCAHSVYPGVYTKVSQYNSWIHQKLGQINY